MYVRDEKKAKGQAVGLHRFPAAVREMTRVNPFFSPPTPSPPLPMSCFYFHKNSKNRKKHVHSLHNLTSYVFFLETKGRRTLGNEFPKV